MLNEFMFKTFRNLNKFFLRKTMHYQLKLLKNRIKQKNAVLKFNDEDKMLYNKIISGKWEYDVKCNYCGSLNKIEYLNNKDINFYNHEFNLKECKKCGLVFCDPRPNFEDLLYFYKLSNWAKKIVKVKNVRPNVLNLHKEVVQQCLFLNKNAKSLFDVGTGGGTLLIEAQRMGLNVSGNDINRESSIYLSKNYGIKIYTEPTNRLSVKKKFDIITMLDYIEHSYTPFDDLQFVSNHLNENGILYLKTLYLNCPNHKRMKNLWNLFDERHFHYFHISTLLNMLNDCKFRLLDVSLSDAIIKIIAKKNN